MNGLARIIVKFYDKDLNLVGRTLTESDGYFSFVGLKPGAYTAEIDKAQLLKLDMSSSPLNLAINIKVSRDGDTVEGLKFILKTN